jgi:hypothetical protein
MGERDRSKSPDTRQDPTTSVRPRVVILDEGPTHHVEVLELPDDASKGDHFRHHGTLWRVTGERRSSQVLIAQPK